MGAGNEVTPRAGGQGKKEIMGTQCHSSMIAVSLEKGTLLYSEKYSSSLKNHPVPPATGAF